MTPLSITAYDLAGRFVGLREVRGAASHPAILAMLRLDAGWPEGDDVPWCSAFANYVAWLLRLPRSKSLRARSWLSVGIPIYIGDAEAGFDVVILRRGANAPGPEVLEAPGHVGFYAGRAVGEAGIITPYSDVLVLGGNQGNQVSIERYPLELVLGVRRLRSA